MIFGGVQKVLMINDIVVIDYKHLHFLFLYSVCLISSLSHTLENLSSFTDIKSPFVLFMLHWLK